MYTFLLYILKVSLSLAAFYMFYKLLCSRDTLHRFNRCLLLFILALSAVVPFMYIDLGIISQEAAVEIGQLGAMLEAEQAEPVEMAAMEDTPAPLWQRMPWHLIPWRMILCGIYTVGLLVCLGHFVGSLLSIALLIRRSKRRVMADGTILVAHNKAYGPFSWMRYIIVSEQDLSDNFDMILAHERAHIHLGHSWDLLFVQLCATAQWFNPAAWLLKRELEAIHEFEADSDTLRQGFDARQYQLRLFEEAVGVKFNTITNNFNNCSTKKRIIMMMKRQTSPWARMKALFVLPVAFAAVTVISCTSPKEKKTDANQENADVIVETNGKGDPLLVLVFPDGTEMYKIDERNWVDRYNKDSKSYLAQFDLTQMNIEAIKVLKEDEAKSTYGERAANGAMKFYLKGTTKKEVMDAMWQHKGEEEPLQVQLIKKSEDGSVSVESITKKSDGDGEFSVYESTKPGRGGSSGNSEEGEIFQVVEEQPLFPGGMQEMMKFLQQNIKYPKEAQEQGKQGRVIVQFVVNKDGSIVNDSIVRSVDPLLDAEALRVVRSMPNWTPGKQKGKPVRVRFTLPVTFHLNGDAPKQATEVKQPEATDDKIFQVVEDQPEFPGGMEGLMKHLSKEIKYPKEAQEKGTQGRVIVQFVVRKDGSITDAKIMKPVDPLLDAEALRVVSEMPNWIPGKQRGEAVNVRFTLPVMFRLSN
ncbi:MAG: TonB family protein [Bacteroidaceae bacterium]|nr:TonB family protein [Bacteroidaceae bacterium]